MILNLIIDGFKTGGGILKNFWELFIKGMPIGIANTLPGISGGTIALVLGIYESLINGIKKINLKVLIPIGFGVIVGVLLGSKLISGLLESQYQGFLIAFLLGLIFASTKVTADQVEKFNLKAIILAILGLVIAFFYSVDINSSVGNTDIPLIKFFFGGAIGSVAMILPGVSGGTILIMLGLYKSVLAAISEFNIPILLSFALGVGGGLLSFSWVLSFLLEGYKSLLMAFLTGLILGSMRSVFPSEITFLEIIGFILGIISIWLLTKSKEWVCF